MKSTMKRDVIPWLLISLLPFAAINCGEAAVVQPFEDTGLADFASPLPDTAHDAPLDLKEDGEPAPDLLSEDISGCEEGEGCFGEPCTSQDDCLSSLCVAHMGDTVCSDYCDSSCPEGWRCKQVAAGAGDVSFICVSDFTQLCTPCDDNSDCSSEISATVCVSFGDEGAFCGALCEDDQGCPSDFICEERTSVDGGESLQCVPAEGALCSCSQNAADLGLSTPCAEANDFGACQGLRTCSDDGLGDCSAPTPAGEICNGQDDNCDGNMDEETCDDQNPCTEDTCLGAEGCSHVPIGGAFCDDGDACTEADACKDSTCTGVVLDCDDENACTLTSCDPLTGCQAENLPGGCSDGDDCTFGDFCQLGECAAGVTLQCDDGNPCTDDSCDETAGCAHVSNEAACDDNNACTEGETCAGEQCTGAQSIVCDDGNPCTTESCDVQNGCLSTFNSSVCDDGNPCTSADACDQAVCAGSETDCDDANLCTNDACNSLIGCTHLANDLGCDDADPCTTTDQCSLGLCVGLGALDCNDDNICTTDVCEPKMGCDYSAANNACSDGDACTLGDACLQGLCATGNASLECDDGNACTDDGCDGESGCTFVQNQALCDDGNACTSDDKCSEGGCAGPQSVDCDDGNLCTSDSCTPLEGCKHVTNSVPCEDGSVCTVGDTCADAVCASGAASLECDDGNGCTDDGCDGESGCTFVQNQAICDDGNACTDADLCESGDCSGSPIDCEDGNSCTDHSCDPQKGCQTVSNDNNACDDGSACTKEDGCVDGACVGLAIVCNDGDKCTLDSCNDVLGCQLAVLTPCCGNGQVEEGEACDGGPFCTDACEQSQPVVPGFSGELGPDFANEGWTQCEGYYDTMAGNEIPATWGDDCTGTSMNQLRVVCGATTSSYRYIDVSKNIFKDGLNAYSENGLITNANYTGYENIIYASGNHPHNGPSWWGGGAGCDEGSFNLTVNNSCSWEASNCFGQNIGGNRFLWVYVK